MGNGTVQLYLGRAVAGVLEFKSSAITWPVDTERRAISMRIASSGAFSHCIGNFDGTIFPFEFKPQIKAAEDYYSRKVCYALNAQVVCNDKCRIRYLYCGWPVSLHDNRAQNCEVQRQSAEYFSKRECLLVDSAYKASHHIISEFKRVEGCH